MNIEAMKHALDALESAADNECHFGAYKNAANRLRQAIEQADSQQVELDRMHEVYYELVEALHQINSIFNYRHRHRVYFVRRLALAMGINQALYSHGDGMSTKPVAWLDSDGFPWSKEGIECRTVQDTYTPLYTTPPRIKFPTALRKMWTGQEVQQWLDEYVGRREWECLTHDEIMQEAEAFEIENVTDVLRFAKMIEARLKEKHHERNRAGTQRRLDSGLPSRSKWR